MATLLPNGKQQFLDSNGAPLSSGLVYTYVPATTTAKNTWQDYNQTSLNTNPVTLDAAGEAVIFGSGIYRQIVKDSAGNLMWDQVGTMGVDKTMVPFYSASSVAAADLALEVGLASNTTPTSPAEYQRWIDTTTSASPIYKVYTGAAWATQATLDTANGAWIVGTAGNFTAAPLIPQTAIGQGYPAHVTVALTTTTALGNNRSTDDEYGLSVNVTNATGHNTTPPMAQTSSVKVGIYGAVKTTGANAGSACAINGVLLVDATATGAIAAGAQECAEFDVVNNTGTDFNTNILTAGLVQPAILGVQISGGGANTASSALSVLGAVDAGTGFWNAGVYIGVNSVAVVGFLDEGGYTAPAGRVGFAQKQYFTTGALFNGTYANYGIDFQGGSYTSVIAMRVPSQVKIAWRNNANSADLNMLQSSSTDDLFIGTDATSLYFPPAKLNAPAFSATTSYANDAAAAGGGVAVGQFYRNGSVVQIRVS